MGVSKLNRAKRVVSHRAIHILDVGCGDSKTPGAVGMDRRARLGVDIVHDCEVLPWPFKDETFDRIILSHLVEHLKPWLMVDIMDELWRVMKPKGQLLIATPYAGSFGFYQDPTHIKAWNEATPTYFDSAYPLYEVYKPRPWRLEQNIWRDMGNLEILMVKE